MEISAEDKSSVDKLRTRVKDLLTVHYDTDFNLLRWLQGYDFDLEAVVPKLRHHLRFRAASWKLDEMTEERNEIQKECWVFGLTGESGKGDNKLVFVEQTGREDVSGYMRSFSGTDLLRAKIFEAESAHRAVMELEEETGKQSHILYIMDLAGLKFDKDLFHAINAPFKSLAKVVADHYVELVSEIVLVNAPAFMYQIWKIVRHFVPEKTRKKVRILSSDWRHEILHYACPDVLPSFWNRMPDFSGFSGDLAVVRKVSEKFHQSDFSLKSQDVQTLCIRAGKCEILDVFVEKEQTKIIFAFHTNGDFGFGVYFAQNSDETDLDKMQMIYPHFAHLGGPTDVPFRDEFICKETGCYKVLFSNANGWWGSLKVQYYIECEIMNFLE